MNATAVFPPQFPQNVKCLSAKAEHTDVSVFFFLGLSYFHPICPHNNNYISHYGSLALPDGQRSG